MNISLLEGVVDPAVVPTDLRSAMPWIGEMPANLHPYLKFGTFTKTGDSKNSIGLDAYKKYGMQSYPVGNYVDSMGRDMGTCDPWIIFKIESAAAVGREQKQIDEATKTVTSTQAQRSESMVKSGVTAIYQKYDKRGVSPVLIAAAVIAAFLLLKG